MIGNLMGMNVVLHDDPKPARFERRCWFERWFTLPWHPLAYFRFVPAESRAWPHGQVMVGMGTIHCYRSEWEAIKEQIPAEVKR